MPRLKYVIPAGFHYEWVEEPAGKWRLVDEDEKGRPCRASARKKCHGEVVAALFRGHPGERGGAWWRYCKDHLYGRRIVDGRIEYRRLVRDDERAA